MEESWISTNDCLLTPPSFRAVTTSTQTSGPILEPVQAMPGNVGTFHDNFVTFVRESNRARAFCDQSWDDMDEILLNISYQFPTDLDLDDGTLLHKAIEEEFASVQAVLDEQDRIHSEFYESDPSISISYSHVLEDYIVMPQSDWVEPSSISQ